MTGTDIYFVRLIGKQGSIFETGSQSRDYQEALRLAAQDRHNPEHAHRTRRAEVWATDTLTGNVRKVHTLKD